MHSSVKIKYLRFGSGVVKKIKRVVKASELRIGNILSFGSPMIMNPILMPLKSGEDIDIAISSKAYYALPLTEAWLDNFGFKQETNSGYWKRDLVYYQGPIQIFVDPLSDKLFLGYLSREYDCEQYNDYEIKYVHQLQNLYHSLTGEELTIKEPSV